MPRKKTTKNKIEYADGKSVEEPRKSVEDILGVKQKNHFNAQTEAEFEENLSAMSVTQMQEMAVNAGVFPSGTKPMLRNKLKKAFAEYMLTSGRLVAPKTTQPHPQSDIAKKFMSIMNTWDR